MNLKKIVREAILKKRDKIYEFGCVMVNLNVDEQSWNQLQKMIDEDDIYFGTKDDTGYGRELDPHVTALYGIHSDVPDEDVETIIDSFKTPKISLKKVSSFKNENFDVLKFDVDSEDMHVMNKMLKELPHTTQFPNYHPHATICYLKSGMADKYIKKMSDIEPISVMPEKVIYSKSDGSKKKYNL